MVACGRWVVRNPHRLASVRRNGAWQVGEGELRHLLSAIIGGVGINPRTCFGDNRELDVADSDRCITIIVEKRTLLDLASTNGRVERYSDGLNAE